MHILGKCRAQIVPEQKSLHFLLYRLLFRELTQSSIFQCIIIIIDFRTRFFITASCFEYYVDATNNIYMVRYIEL